MNCDFQVVFDHDTFSMDDKMGDADFNRKMYIEALPCTCNGIRITRVQPCKQNCLDEKSCMKVVRPRDMARLFCLVRC